MDDFQDLELDQTPARRKLPKQPKPDTSGVASKKAAKNSFSPVLIPKQSHPQRTAAAFLDHKVLLDIPAGVLKNLSKISKVLVNYDYMQKEFTHYLHTYLQDQINPSKSHKLTCSCFFGDQNQDLLAGSAAGELVIPVVVVAGTEVPVETVRNIFLFIKERARKSAKKYSSTTTESKDSLKYEYSYVTKLLLKSGLPHKTNAGYKHQKQHKQHGLLLEMIEKIINEWQQERMIKGGPSESEISLLQETNKIQDINTKLKRRMKYEKGEGLLDYMGSNSIFQQNDAIQLLRKALYLQNINFSERYVKNVYHDLSRPASVQSLGDDPEEMELRQLDLDAYLRKNGELPQEEVEVLQELIDWHNDLRNIVGRS